MNKNVIIRLKKTVDVGSNVYIFKGTVLTVKERQPGKWTLKVLDKEVVFTAEEAEPVGEES